MLSLEVDVAGAGLTAQPPTYPLQPHKPEKPFCSMRREESLGFYLVTIEILR